jgi:hypothetical protein
VTRSAAIFLLLAAGCTGGSVVNLGATSPRPFRFGTPALVTDLGAGFANDNPTLTADLLEMYFTSNRDMVSTDVFVARRASRAEPFRAPELVAAVSTPGFETSSAVSLDGLTLWVGSDRPGGRGDLDVWMSTRPDRAAAWSPPVNLLSLNSPMKDEPRPPGQHGLVMPLGSERDTATFYRTYLSARASRTSPFGAPRDIPELSFVDKSTVDAFLTDDGLALFFSSGPPVGAADLYVAWRRSTAEPFSLVEPLDDLNTAAEDRDPWLSPDGTVLFFSSDRGGTLDIYQAQVMPR